MRPGGWGRCAVVLANVLLACPCAFALNPALDISQYAHTPWKIRDGFSKGEIDSIAQTPDGYLWLGTEFGLLRFDGVRNVLWQPPRDQQLPSNRVTRLLAARNGTLWIGTLSGLAAWKNGKLTQYAELAGLSVYRLLEDHQGSVWAGATGVPNGKLCEFQKGAVRCYPEIAGLGKGVVGLHEDDKGNLWVGLWTGVWQWRPGSPQFYPVPGEPAGVQGMVDTENGGLLVSTKGGLSRLVDGKLQMAYPLPATMRESYAKRLLRDRDGGLWVEVAGRGIVHLHQGRTDAFSQSDGLTGDGILDFFEDREGSIWVATTNGLDRFRELPVVTYSTKQGFSSFPTGAVLSARDGSIWFGTLDGPTRLEDAKITVYRQSSARAVGNVEQPGGSGLSDFVGSLFQDSRGRIWVSTLTRVGYLENDRSTSSVAPGGNVSGISEDTAGNVWIANEDLGLFRLSPRNELQRIAWSTFGHTDHAAVLARDPLQGGVWLGFYKGGVTWFHEGQVRSYSQADGLGEGRVNDLRFDREGTLWAATEGGLSRLKNGRITTLTRKNGLPCDAVHWTMEDDAQSVWLSMPCGLVRVARSELDAWASAADKTGRAIHCRVFDSSDGVRILSYAHNNSPRVAKSRDGRLWFSVLDGIGMVDPRHIPINKLAPPVQIEKIIADRKNYWENLSGDAQSNPRLPPLVRDLTIDYTALSLVAPEKMRLRFKLEGRDSDWRDDVDNRRQAVYTDLPPRHYRFRVIACNNSGVWNEAGASFDFAIEPKFYQTTWFLAVCVAGFIALLGAVYQLRLRFMSRQFNIRLEERVQERTRIARDLHDTLLQSFQGVLLRFHALTFKLPERSEFRADLEAAIEQARKAVTEGRDAVQGLRSSTLITNDLARSIGLLTEGLRSEQADGKCPEFRVQVEGKTRDLPPLVRDEVYRIGAEAVSNAFRHGSARRIEVDIHYDKRQFALRVRDNGKGIDPHVLEEGGRVGHHGLPGMHERARLAGGKLTVWSELDSGTEIELTIPAVLAYAKAAAAPRANY
jgi:signal transduction histidine kinase/ligand-binding sensor domain-containing protein